MPHLDLKLFGSFEVKLDGKPIQSFGTDKVRALLAYLAVEATQPHPREYLASLLWPDQPEKQAQHNFRQALSTLRKLLQDEENNPPFILVNGDQIQFNSRSDQSVDFTHFHRQLDSALHYFSQRTHPGRVDLSGLHSSLAIFRGLFLERFSLADSGEFDEWAILQREHCNQRAIQALALLADYHEKREEFLLARQVAERLVDLAPWDETAHLQVVRLLAQDGQWNLVQARYQSMRRQLLEQMDLEPSAETVALFETMRKYAAANQPFPPRYPPPEHNLRLPGLPFIGREVEIAQLSSLLANPNNRLITLIGVGGIGKSRLALQAAHAQIGLFPDGVWFVPVHEQSLLPGLAGALRFAPVENEDLQTQLLRVVANKQMLLLLDGFEHIQPEAEIVSDLIQAAPGLTVIATSRQRLDLQDEILFPLDGLEIPPEDARSQADLEEYSAAALFLSRARRLRPQINLLPGQSPALIQICRVLEGMPLGLELAAAATWNHSIEEIAVEIKRSLDFLKAHYPDLPPRHRSLRAAFNHSWALLTPPQQEAIAGLSVFQGSFLSAHAAEVTQSQPEILGELLDRSLLRQTGEGRLEIPEPILPFLVEELEKRPGRVEALRASHARFFADLCAGQEEALAGSGLLQAIQVLLPELGNILQAWKWAVANQQMGEVEDLLEPLHQLLYTRSAFQDAVRLFEESFPRLAGSLPGTRLKIRLGLHLLRSGRLDEARQSLQAGLDEARRWNVNEEIVLGLSFISNIHRKAGEKDLALQLTQELLALSKATQNLSGMKSAWYLLGEIAFKAGDVRGAIDSMQESLRIARQIGNPLGILSPLNTLGDYACQEEDYPRAVEIFTECLVIARSLGSQYNISMNLNNLGTIHHLLGEYPQAVACYVESEEICRAIGDQEGEAIALSNLGEIATAQEEFSQAMEYYSQALQIGLQTRSDWVTAIAWINLGKLHHAMGKAKEAWEYLQKGIQIAWDNQTLYLVLKSMATMGSILVNQGHGGLGLRVLAAVCTHPASEPDDRKSAESLLGAAPTANASTDLPTLVSALLAFQG